MKNIAYILFGIVLLASLSGNAYLGYIYNDAAINLKECEMKSVGKDGAITIISKDNERQTGAITNVLNTGNDRCREREAVKDYFHGIEFGDFNTTDLEY